MTKPETIAQLKRKIERLEARLAQLEDMHESDSNYIRENMYRAVDAEVRIKHAMRILTGEDEV